MCGFSGFADFKHRSDLQVLEAMTGTLSHRGPDDAGAEIFSSDKALVGLGHRRLSIIDLSKAGHQPMHCGELSIVFNGEIYNYAEVRAELMDLGHRFVTQSDTEVILQAYQRWGKDAVRKFTGMFAFVIYDRTKQELFCCRDRAGVKPFFYYYKDGLFLFSSELKAFHRHPAFTAEIDRDALAAYLQLGNVPGEHCIFNNCHKLLPAHWLRLDLGTGRPESRPYWNVYDAYNQPKMEIGFEEALEKTEQVLSRAFEYRMVADVPVGIFLSGGYDSTCVAALLQKNSSRKLRTFSIGVEDKNLDESPYARKIAGLLGTDHTEHICTATEALELIDSLPYYYDEPFGDSSAIPTMLVSRLARRSVTVALSGDGGDETFAGYNRYDYLIRYGRKLNKIPAFARHLLSAGMGILNPEHLPILGNSYNFSNRYEKLKLLLKDPSPRNMMLNLSRQFSDKEMQSLFNVTCRPPDSAYYSEELKKVHYSPLAYMMAIDYQTYLVDDILQKVDRASMSVSLEAREPYLDHHVIEWAARLPDRFKYHKTEKKYILKQIVHKYIPAAEMQRPKMGFAVPVETWLNKELKEKVDHYLGYNFIRDQGLLQPEKIKELRTRFQSGRKELSQKIWYLLMLGLWYEKWMK